MNLSEADLNRISDDLEVRKVSMALMLVVAARLLADEADISMDEAKNLIVRATIGRMKEGL